MAHSYVEEKRLLLGLGDIYLNNVLVGQLKGTVSLHYKVGYAYQKPGNMLGDVKGERISEDAELSAEVCDIRPSQLRLALGLNQAIASDAIAIRKREQLKLSTTTAKTTAQTPVAASIRVYKLDRSTMYVQGADYTVTTNTITRVGAGTITSGQVVAVEYDFSNAAAKSVQVGGEITAPNTFTLDFVHEKSDGKSIQLTFYKAMVNTDFTMAFNEKSGGKFTTYGITFKALVDLTKQAGNNLFEITEEDGPIS
jgi:hypothetical protein